MPSTFLTAFLPPELPFRYPIARILLKKLAKLAGITKRVNPHTFRHSRATALASTLTEAQMKAYFGWVQGSRTAGVYVHLSGRDVDGAILGMYGMKDKPETSDKFKPVSCPRCNSARAPGSRLCNKCGYGLSIDVALELEEKGKKANNFMEKLMNDPEFKELILKKLIE